MKRLLLNFYHPLVSILLLGIGSALYFGLIGTVWAVTGEFTRWGGHILSAVGYPVKDLTYLTIVTLKGMPWERSDGWVVFGMFAGALIAALAGNNFKIRVPVQRRRLLQGLVGGMIAGFGARLAMGCNLAALFTGVPQFTLHAMLFTAGTVAGSWVGLKITLMPFLLGKPKLTRTIHGPVKATILPQKNWQQPLALIAGVCFSTTLIFSAAQGLTKLALAGLFGWIFGWLIQKGQVCFTSAFRDLWISGRTVIIKALVWGMALQTIGTAWFIFHGMPAKVMWAGPSAIIGGILFGIGIVVAGGCETGWMYRAMEGQTHFWMVGVGNVIGATALMLLWDRGIFSLFVEGWPKVDLVATLGWPVALAAVYVFLFLLYGFALFMERKKQFTPMIELPLDDELFTKRG